MEEMVKKSEIKNSITEKSIMIITFPDDIAIIERRGRWDKITIMKIDIEASSKISIFNQER